MALHKVKTKYGVVVGVPTETGTVFKGIPFAKPPVGELRFCAPQEPECWEGELVCDSFKSICVQYDRKYGMPGAKLDVMSREEKRKAPFSRHPLTTPFPTPKAEEDCLYLNIWTPAEAADEKLPVMVWIYGGAFSGGCSYLPEIDGGAMNARGVILVSIAYRTGPMGFITHPELTKRDPLHANGNYGLLDEVAALRWVHENITAFGGDPDRVTIHGHSAGGISTKFHIVSPLSKGLFRRAIIQSGGGLNAADPTRPLAELQEITQKALDLLGWTVDDLVTRDAYEVSDNMGDAAEEVLAGKEYYVYQPCIDGNMLPEIPEKLLYDGKMNIEDIICGTVQGDSWMFCRKVKNELLDKPDTVRAFGYSPGVALARHQVKTGRPPIRTYFFERTVPNDPLGTPHGSDKPYIFGTLDRFDRPWSEYDRELSVAENSYWTNFAKTGDPNGPGLPEWPLFTADAPLTMHFRNDGFCAEDLVDCAEAEHVIDFVEEHPGMLETLVDF